MCSHPQLFFRYHLVQSPAFSSTVVPECAESSGARNASGLIGAGTGYMRVPPPFLLGTCTRRSSSVSHCSGNLTGGLQEKLWHLTGWHGYALRVEDDSAGFPRAQNSSYMHMAGRTVCCKYRTGCILEIVDTIVIIRTLFSPVPACFLEYRPLHRRVHRATRRPSLRISESARRKVAGCQHSQQNQSSAGLFGWLYRRQVHGRSVPVRRR
ncbi:hypothetical protein FA95DRAFT_1395608 [Auriscalpium vulgare]|uniref:Uncharacterized protein n=1 Tax=Auriscalpium vulgare TaxID=40419 RepID=A0ACB8RQU2_9AGAM|nr:hypothetical protein FA95DRAFT_1395608 [Auriscalpium vulgare]